MSSKNSIEMFTFGKKSLDNYYALLMVFLLFFLTSPYFFWTWYGSLLANVLVSTIALVIVWINKKKIKGKEKTVYVYFVAIWLFYCFVEFYKGARLGVVANLPFVLVGLIPYIKKDLFSVVFDKFVTVYAILIGFSMISWIAAMTGMISPIGEFGMENESLEAQKKSYLVYPLALVSTKSTDEFSRFCGIFDEPGVVGSLAGLILCALRFNMKDWRSIIVLLSGLLSTSMFFYAIAAVYWFSELIFVKKRIGVLLFVITGVFSAYHLTKDDDVMYHLVWKRFEWDSKKGGFVGNTREDEGLNRYMGRIWNSGEIWFGVNNKKGFWDENHGASSIYTVVALYGIVFVSMYLVWLLMIGYQYKVNKWEFFLYCFVVLGCMYQRPSIYSIPYTFLFVSIANSVERERLHLCNRKVKSETCLLK